MLDVEDRREDLVPGEGERDDDTLAAFGESDRLGSERPLAGVEARVLAPLNGSDLARIRLRLRARVDMSDVINKKSLNLLTSIWWAQCIGLRFRPRRLEARLPRRRGKVDVDLRRRHRVSLAKISALVDCREWLVTLSRVHFQPLLSTILIIHGLEAEIVG